MECGEVRDAINELKSKADNCGSISNNDFAYLMELIEAMLLCGNYMQVNSDWNATSGLPFILNKPTIPIQNNFVRQIKINYSDLPEDYTKEDIMDYIEGLPPAEREIIDTDSKFNVVIFKTLG